MYANDASGFTGSLEAKGWTGSTNLNCNGPAGTVFTQFGSEEILSVNNGPTNPFALGNSRHAVVQCASECVPKMVSLGQGSGLGVVGPAVRSFALSCVVDCSACSVMWRAHLVLCVAGIDVAAAGPDDGRRHWVVSFL